MVLCYIKRRFETFTDPRRGSMKKSILTLGIFLITVAAAYSETVITGNVYDSTWNKDGSPYRVQGAAVIPAGATVKAGPGVQVVFAPGASLEVQGTLRVAGEASYPTKFTIPAGGAYLLVKGGELTAVDARFIGGYFVVDGGKVDVTASEITGGSGPYLRGATTAVFRSNKIYGNSSGFTLDGDQVQAKFIFNTIVSNTYGLHLKKYATLMLENNSIHDNFQSQVVNDLPAPAVLGNNFWGSTDVATVPVRGAVRLEPLKTMKDVLREYVMTQLPNLPAKKMAQVVKNAKAEKAADVLAKKKAAKMRKADALAEAKAAKLKQLAEKKAAEKAALEAKIKEVAPAEATPAVTAVSAEVAATPAASNFGELETNNAAAPAPAPAVAETTAPAVVPAEAAPAAVASATTAPVASTDVAAAPAVTAPAATDAMAISAPSNALPDIPGLVAPPSTDATAPAASSAPAAAPAVAPAVPVDNAAAPALPAATTPAAVPAPATAAVGAPAVPAGTDFNPGMIPAPPTNVPASNPAAGAPPDLSGLDLPPLNDKPIQAPKDLDLPPLDDLGNLKTDMK
jgi:hypothetical protein